MMIPNQNELQAELAMLRQRVAELEAQQSHSEFLQIQLAKNAWENTVDVLPQLLCVLNDKKEVLRVNRTVERWQLGTLSGVRGLHVHLLLHPRCQADDCYLKQFLDDGWAVINQEYHYEMDAEDTELGRFLNLQLHTFPDKHHSSHDKTAVTLVVHDITHRKRTTDATIRAQEEHFHDVITSISDHVYFSSYQNGQFNNLYMSPNIEELTGYPLAVLVNDWKIWPEQIIHPDDRAKAEKQAQKIADGYNSEMEYRIISAAGEVRWVRDSARIKMKNGQHLVYGVVSNVTPRKSLESELREYQTLLEQKVADRTGQLEFIASVSGRINAALGLEQILLELVNQVKRNFGYYHAHIYILDDAHHYLIMRAGSGVAGEVMKERGHKILLAAEKSLVARAARKGKVVMVDNVRLAPDWLPNELLPETYSEMAVPIIAEGEVVGVLDVQENRIGGFDENDANTLRSLANQIAISIENAKLYDQLNGLNDELIRLNTDKDKFFSIVAHDLKGPFLPLMGNLELLVEMGDTFSGADIKQMASSSLRSSKLVFELLQNLLTWARIQMGRMEYDPQPIELQEVAQKTVELLTPVAIEKQITLTSEIPAGMTIQADRNMMDTIIRNLTNNSLKFTSSMGQVTLQAAHIEPDCVTISIVDTGVGMDEETLQKIFRIDAHHTTRGTNNEGGTGLGIIMCQEMVEINGGRIWVESQLGQGSTFFFTVPLAKEVSDS